MRCSKHIQVISNCYKRCNFNSYEEFTTLTAVLVVLCQRVMKKRWGVCKVKKKWFN